MTNAKGTSVDDFIRTQRETLHADRVSAQSRLIEVEKELAEIDRQLRAFDVFETALSTKTDPPQLSSRSSRRTEIIRLLKGEDNGLSRSEILDRLHAKEDRSAQRSISNALANMKKAGKVDLSEGRYFAAA